MPYFQLYVGHGLDKGLQRDDNEDALAYHHPDDWQQYCKHGALFVVADGVGSLDGGFRASDHAVRGLIEQYYPRATQNTVEMSLDKALRSLNQQIHSTPQSGATTIVAAVIRANDLVVAHVGDSRAYLISNRQVRQLTQDQVQPVTRPDGRVKNKLLQALGYKDSIQLEMQQFQLPLHSRLVLMTDGAIRYLDNAILLNLSQQYPQPQDFASAIVNYSNQQGGVDNIAVIVVDVEDVLADARALNDHILNLKQKPIAETSASTRLSSVAEDNTRVSQTEVIPQATRKQSPGLFLLLLIVVSGVLAALIYFAGFLSSPPEQAISNATVTSDASDDIATPDIVTATPSPEIDSIQQGVLLGFDDSAATYIRIQDELVAFVIEINRTYEVTDSYQSGEGERWYQLYDERNDVYGWIAENDLPDYHLNP